MSLTVLFLASTPVSTIVGPNHRIRLQAVGIPNLEDGVSPIDFEASGKEYCEQNWTRLVTYPYREKLYPLLQVCSCLLGAHLR